MKNLIKLLGFRLIVAILNSSRINTSSIIFNLICLHRPSMLKRLLRNLNVNSLFLSTNSKHVRRYSIFKPEESAVYNSEILKDSCFESIHMPKVWGVSKGGSISVYERAVVLYKFCNAEITPISDFIRVGDAVYWDKSHRFQLVKTLVQDQDLVYYDKEAGYVFLVNTIKKVRLDIGFSMCGVHMTSWGHFVGNFLPKLASLTNIHNCEDVTIILPKSVDAHIKEMVTITAQNYGVNKIIFIEDSEAVVCKQLYYCSGPSFVVDHADYIQPYDQHLSDWALSKIRVITAIPPFHSEVSNTSSKLFIGRRGYRMLKNWEEVEQYFIQNGFEVIFPHQLSLMDKISKFSNATHICGPWSSGFANVIFCKPGTKILAFCNIARIMESFLSDIADGEFNFDATLLIGDEDLPAGPHQAYSIPLEKIVDALVNMKFNNIPESAPTL